MSATARLGFGLIFGEDEPQGRQVLDLPFLDALGRWIRQEAPTTLALLHMVDFCVIGLFDHFERMSRYVRAVRRIFVCLSCAGFWARVS